MVTWHGRGRGVMSPGYRRMIAAEHAIVSRINSDEKLQKKSTENEIAYWKRLRALIAEMQLDSPIFNQRVSGKIFFHYNTPPEQRKQEIIGLIDKVIKDEQQIDWECRQVSMILREIDMLNPSFFTKFRRRLGLG